MKLTNKIDFAVIFEVKNANPNGDPLNGNRPRTTNEGLGELSDVCIKRKIRDRLLERGSPIFVQSDDRKIDSCTSLRKRAEDAQVLTGDNESTIKLACEKWFDVRAFGQLFAYTGKKAKKQKKTKNLEDDEVDSGGEDSVPPIGIRGPVSIHQAFSIGQINITSSQITKSVNNEGDGKKKSSDTMGTKHRVDHGIYVFYGTMNPQLAAKTGFSEEDAETLKAVLPKLFENDASSARPEGSMRVLKVIWWHHSCPTGQYSSAKVHSSLSVLNDGACPYRLNELPGLKVEIIDGF
jgi:CRISPR-associated protein Csd2